MTWSIRSSRTSVLALAAVVVSLLRGSVLLEQQPQGIPVFLPEQASSRGCPGDYPRPVLTVGAHGSLWLNHEWLSREDLAGRLNEFFRTSVQRVVFVQATPNAAYQDLIMAIDTARLAVDHVGLVPPSALDEPCLRMPPLSVASKTTSISQIAE